MSIPSRILRRARRILNPPPPFTLIFLHIPKTGGMSLHEVLHRCARGRPTFWIADPVKDIAWLKSIPLEERERFIFVEGHMYYGVHELLPRPCKYLTILRDPVERVLSYYSHIRERPDHHLHEAVARESLSLAECIRRGLTVELDNYMVRALTSLDNVNIPFGAITPAMLSQARSHLDGMLVGLTERLEESIAHFRKQLGWPLTDVPRVNKTAARLKQTDLSPADLELVRQTNALDADLYRHATSLFESGLAASPPQSH